jgi:hypothetical protein
MQVVEVEREHMNHYNRIQNEEFYQQEEKMKKKMSHQESREMLFLE